MEDVGIFYGHLVHFTVFCYILRTFGTVRGNLVYISRFGILSKEKSGNPDSLARVRVTRLGEFSPIEQFYLRTNFSKSYIYMRAPFLGYIIKFDKICLGSHLGRFFYQNIWSPWLGCTRDQALLMSRRLHNALKISSPTKNFIIA
jgi:hypothetical protein